MVRPDRDTTRSQPYRRSHLRYIESLIFRFVKKPLRMLDIPSRSFTFCVHGVRPPDSLSPIDKYACSRCGDIGPWARRGNSAQAEAVGGEDCSDDGKHQEVGGGVGPEQAVSAELGETLTFEPNHGCDGNVSSGEEGAKPAAGIVVVRPHDV